MSGTKGTWTRRLAALGAAGILAAGVALAGCGTGGALKDGAYTGQSAQVGEATDEDSGYGVVQLTVKDGSITDCTYQTYEVDGTLKDENYGKSLSGNDDKYKKAQKAVQACDEYAKQLVEKGDVDDVDVISGATNNYNEFVDAVDDALAQARS